MISPNRFCTSVSNESTLPDCFRNTHGPKPYFQIFKYSGENSYTFGHSMFAHKVSVKKNILCGLCKIWQFFILSYDYAWDVFFFVFLHTSQNMFLFAEILCASCKHRISECWRNFFFWTFLTFSCTFLCISIMDVFIPTSHHLHQI
jgi:hypothetical protein